MLTPKKIYLAPRAFNAPMVSTSMNHFYEFLRTRVGGGFSAYDVQRQALEGRVYIDSDKLCSGQALSVNSALPYGGAQEIDKTVTEAITATPRLFLDLQAANCVKNFSFGTYIAHFLQQSAVTNPVVAMDFTDQIKLTGSIQGQLDYTQVTNAIPLMYYHFGLSKRQIAAGANVDSMNGGINIETEEIRNRSKYMSFAIDQLLWYGAPSITLSTDGGSPTPIYGFSNHPSIPSVDITFSQADPLQFISDVKNQLIQPLLNAKFEPPFVCYYGQNMLAGYISDDYQVNTLRTVGERLLQYGLLSDLRSTQFLNPLDPANNDTQSTMIVMKMDPMAVMLLKSAEIQVAQISDNPMIADYLIFCAMAPRIVRDYYGSIGIIKANITLTS